MTKHIHVVESSVYIPGNSVYFIIHTW